MTYPKLMTTLFDNDGGGDKLNESVLPTVAVKATAQSLTDSQKTQARTNIGAVSSAEVDTAVATKVSTSDLQTALSELITSYGGTVPS